jgi:hypothetical protein
MANFNFEITESDKDLTLTMYQEALDKVEAVIAEMLSAHYNPPSVGPAKAALIMERLAFEGLLSVEEDVVIHTMHEGPAATNWSVDIERMRPSGDTLTRLFPFDFTKARPIEDYNISDHSTHVDYAAVEEPMKSKRGRPALIDNKEEYYD